MKEQLEKIRADFTQKINEVEDLAGIENLRISFLGKKGELTSVLRGMGKVSPEERPIIGQLANEVRSRIEAGLNARIEDLKKAAREQKLKNETLDVTMPGKLPEKGAFHPLQQVIEEMENVFELSVPLDVDVNLGKNWYEAK